MSRSYIPHKYNSAANSSFNNEVQNPNLNNKHNSLPLSMVTKLAQEDQDFVHEIIKNTVEKLQWNPVEIAMQLKVIPIIWIWDIWIGGLNDLCALREPGDPDLEMRHPANVRDQVQAYQWGGGGRQDQGQEDLGQSEILRNETWVSRQKVVFKGRLKSLNFSLSHIKTN